MIIAEKLKSWTIDIQEVVVTVYKAVIDATFLYLIYSKISKATLEMVKCIT